MTNKGGVGFPSTDNVVPAGAITTAGLSPGLQAWLTSSQLASGEEVFPRIVIKDSTVSMATQSMRLMYFTARKTETVTQIKMYSGGTNAGATPTLCRMGIYSIDSYGNGVLVASVANDTSLFGTGSTAYTRTFTSPLNKVAGATYAAAVLVVSTQTMPTMGGFVSTSLAAAEYALAPRMTGIIASQSDLPASFAASSLSTSSAFVYAALLP